MRNGDSACPVAAGDDAGEMADRAGEDRKPVSRSPGHGWHLGPGSSCPARSASLTRMPGYMCREGRGRAVAAGCRRLPAGKPAGAGRAGTGGDPGPPGPTWSQRAGAGGSMMSAACRSARAIRSRGLTLCSSWVSSETSSRNGVRSSTPGSPPVFATRLALAAWAVRRAWSATRPATRPLSRVPSATATSRPVPGLTGVSGAAPGCVSRAASACGSSDTTITSLRDPGRPGVHDGQERSPPGSCLHGNHL
jgi:hypothetical protein